MKRLKFLWLLLFFALPFIVRNHFFQALMIQKKSSLQVEVKAPPKIAPQEVIHSPHRPKPFLSPKNFSSQRVPSQAKELTKVPHPGLPEGYQIVQDVYAVKETKAKDLKENKVAEARGYVFFQSEGNPLEGANVVIDESSAKLYPLSSVVKVTKVSEALRSDLLAKGFNEHFYHEDLQIMYLQSSHAEVLNLFDQLSRLGLKPEFEILRGNHRSK